MYNSNIREAMQCNDGGFRVTSEDDELIQVYDNITELQTEYNTTGMTMRKYGALVLLVTPKQ